MPIINFFNFIIRIQRKKIEITACLKEELAANVVVKVIDTASSTTIIEAATL